MSTKKPAAKAPEAPTTPPVRCAHARLADTASLVPHRDNPNTHPPDQIALYARILAHQGWRRPITVSKQSGMVVTGHGALLAAKAQGWPKVPVDDQDFDTPADEAAHLIADNKLPQMSELDDTLLARLIDAEVRDKLDIDLTGFALPEESGEEAPLPEPPPSVEENLAHLEEIKAQRRKGNENIVGKTDTEFYLVIAFPNRAEKEALLKRLGLPEDERYLTPESVLILPGTKPTASLPNAKLPKASPPNKSGACG
jgi:hypothetical protein